MRWPARLPPKQERGFATAGFLACAGFVGWALLVAPAEKAGTGFTAVGSAFSNGQPVTVEARASALAAFAEGRPALACRSDLLNAGGALLLSDTDEAGVVKPGAVKAAGQVLLQSVACSPWQANTWLTLAFIRVQDLGFDALSEQLIDMSYALAPREAWIALRRVRLEIQREKPREPAAEARLDAAILDLAEGALWRDLVEIFHDSRPPARQRLMRALETASKETLGRFMFHVLWRK
mgnify:CR=1 FL=1